MSPSVVPFASTPHELLQDHGVHRITLANAKPHCRGSHLPSPTPQDQAAPHRASLVSHRQASVYGSDLHQTCFARAATQIAAYSTPTAKRSAGDPQLVPSGLTPRAHLSPSLPRPSLSPSPSPHISHYPLLFLPCRRTQTCPQIPLNSQPNGPPLNSSRTITPATIAPRLFRPRPKQPVQHIRTPVIRVTPQPALVNRFKKTADLATQLRTRHLDSEKVTS